MFTYLEVLLCAYLCSCNERGIHSALLTQAFSVSCESQLKILKRTFGRKGEYWEYFEIFTLNLGWITIKEVYVGSHWVAEGVPFKKKDEWFWVLMCFSKTGGGKAVPLSHRLNKWEFIFSGEIRPSYWKYFLFKCTKSFTWHVARGHHSIITIIDFRTSFFPDLHQKSHRSESSKTNLSLYSDQYPMFRLSNIILFKKKITKQDLSLCYFWTSIMGLHTLGLQVQDSEFINH